ncbi:CHAD domain-containing protein [Mucilaginibacter conchicola]|uniref:CHAD domain-containing protein n=1 Tax=Mucilaginibacter conchicola TaxID=2303333 RepID=UPI001313DDCD|nr:CHAD domain-containing protein [Mucilaginibacter conchicola]
MKTAKAVKGFKPSQVQTNPQIKYCISMDRKELKAQVIRRHHAAEQSLRSYISSGEQKHLHRFRTGIKKLRALAALVEQAAPVKLLHDTLQPIKKTFRAGGEIRDAHQYLQLGQQEQTAPAGLASKEKQMKKHAKLFRSEKRKHIKRLDKAKGALIRKLRPVKNFELNRFYDRELLAIGLGLQHAESEEQLHDSRKRLKVLLYDLPVVRHVLKLQISEDYLEQVQTAIGDWHDNLLASEHFPSLTRQTLEQRKDINELTADFYEKATSPADLALQQID